MSFSLFFHYFYSNLGVVLLSVINLSVQSVS